MVRRIARAHQWVKACKCNRAIALQAPEGIDIATDGGEECDDSDDEFSLHLLIIVKCFDNRRVEIRCGDGVNDCA